MGKSTYYKKRIKSGLSKTDMANELGIDYKRYNLIEGGDVKMPNKLMDKFNEIINRGKENKLNALEYGVEADTFWKEMSVRNADGSYKLHEKCKEFNIEGFKELAHLLGYKSPGMTYLYLKEPNKANDDFKKRLYMFFSNELNIQAPVNKNTNDNVKHRKCAKRVNEELKKYYEKTDFKKLLEDNNLNYNDIRDNAKVDKAVISRMVNKQNQPVDSTMQRIKDYLDSVVNDYKPIELSAIDMKTLGDSMPIYYEEVEPSIVKKYKDELLSIDNSIEECRKAIEAHEQHISFLKVRQGVCLEILDVIDKVRKGE